MKKLKKFHLKSTGNGVLNKMTSTSKMKKFHFHATNVQSPSKSSIYILSKNKSSVCIYIWHENINNYIKYFGFCLINEMSLPSMPTSANLTNHLGLLYHIQADQNSKACFQNTSTAKSAKAVIPSICSHTQSWMVPKTTKDSKLDGNGVGNHIHHK